MKLPRKFSVGEVVWEDACYTTSLVETESVMQHTAGWVIVDPHYIYVVHNIKPTGELEGMKIPRHPKIIIKRK